MTIAPEQPRIISQFLRKKKTVGVLSKIVIGVRAGGARGLQPPQLQKFLKFFGQNADDSGKSIREKIL